MTEFMNASGTSTRPYLIRALYEWCTDNGFTPYVAVAVDPSVQVPREYVKNNEIVLNIGFDATSSLTLGNEFIEFKARFGGISREIMVPVNHVIAIYARENGQGMAFPLDAEPEDGSDGYDELQGQAVEKMQDETSTAQGLTEAIETPQRVPEHKLMQLVESASDNVEARGEPAGDAAPTPPQPPTPPRPRPSLKRVK